MSNIVYSSWHSAPIGAGITLSSSFVIRSTGREIKVKSITLNWQIIDPATSNKIDWRTVTDQILWLQVGSILLPKNTLTRAFLQVGGTAPFYQGNAIVITEPKQLIFDSFYISNELPFNLQINNLNGNQRDHYVTIIVETEEKTMFQQT